MSSKREKHNEFKNMSVGELFKRLHELRMEKEKQQQKKVFGKKVSVEKVRKIKKDIARCLTEINKRRLGIK